MVKRATIELSGITESEYSAAIQALRDAGIQQNQMVVTDPTAPGGGRAANITAALLALAAAGCLLAWIWVGDWRFGPTAALALVILAFGMGHQRVDR